ncbi:ectonucleoside triphosphate diphosphohydrolase 2 [Spea bombifrons]|uniref:ectonucleoside triphosphate diphosphohydrolase 2 n=1 Tax=Spea bombifrons TaxID=233779 RepID=UPI0023499AC8|nr:ectonucleoside triphosphate diphosphohydrolase 2 [Spea bombifrons]
MAKKLLALALPAALCLVGVIGILLLALPPTKDIKGTPDFKYGIVLDAGSSHTALFVYKWPADKENETGIVSQHSMCDVEGPGISSYYQDPPEAGKSLEPCLKQAVKDVPASRHSMTPVYLGATAGMRLLNWTNQAASDKVLDAVSATLKSYPFDFRGAKILSGQDEGVFGWVTANYLMENFVKYSWIGQWFQPRRGTLGAMDLGGASTQITFETSDKIESPENERNLRLYGQSYRVYTHSFLCYGRDQVLKRTLSKVLKSQGYASDVQNPCWPKNHTASLTFGDVYESPCTAGEKPPNYDPAAPIKMAGSGDAGECTKQVESLFQFSSCSFSSCSFDNVFQPDVSGKFIAFAAFFYTVDFMKTVMKMPVDTLEDLHRATDAICSSTWNDLTSKAPPSLHKHLNGYCATANFVYLLTSRGYRFNNETFPDIVFQRKAGDTSIGWALGYMLNLTNMIPAEEASVLKATSFSSWGALIFLFVLIILLALIIFFSALRSNKQQQTI